MAILCVSAHAMSITIFLTIPERSGIICTMKKRKNPAAVTLGRKGGLKGGPARAANMTAKERQESAKKAAMARWSKKAT